MIYKYRLTIKRFLDINGSLIGLIILFPILLIISILIKIDSPGPIIFKQKRLGINGVEFDIYKFRTMVIDAETKGDGLTIKNEKDERITKIGGILRKASLDELPQFINVFKGNMSFVGPRPPVTYYPYDGYENYPDWAKERFKMKPGITGLSQTKVRNSVSWDSRILIDNQYINNFNILLDMKIIFKTMTTVIMNKNIY